MLRVSHIAIDLADLQASMALPEFQKCKKNLSSQLSDLNGKYVISSIDRAHPISGIRHKLLAY
jgi:trehalose-6-phosphate synthase